MRRRLAARLPMLALVALVLPACTKPDPPPPGEAVFVTSGGSEATGINDAGWIVGTLREPYSRAFVARPGEAAVDLGTLPGEGHTSAAGINDAGTVVGTSQRAAFRWTAEGGMEPLATPEGQDSEAAAVNDAGAVVGWVSPSNSDDQAVVWLPDATAPTVLPSPGWSFSRAYAINGRGQIVGYAGGENAAGSFRQVAMLWEPRPDGTWAPVERFPSPYALGAGATALNEAGEVVGFSVLTQGLNYAARWAAGTHRLSLLPQARQMAVGTDINKIGTAVGYDSNFGGGETVAWVRRPGGAVERRVVRLNPGQVSASINDHDVLAATLAGPDGVSRAARIPLVGGQ